MSRLEIHRRRVGVSQADLAARVGVSRQYIGAMERGHRGTESVRAKVCEALGLPDPDELFPPEEVELEA